MVTEVNKIIYNLIVSGREVCIGGVGTLFTVRYAAYRASRKSLVPPYRIVEFTAEQRGVLLEEEIARAAGVDAQKAHELFEHWLSAVVDGETLTIEGVGKLRKDKFVADEAFLAALNPQAPHPCRRVKYRYYRDRGIQRLLPQSRYTTRQKHTSRHLPSA